MHRLVGKTNPTRMPTGLYVHLPFCRVRCTYCPFAISTDLSRQDQYTDALIGEIAARGTSEEADTLFFRRRNALADQRSQSAKADRATACEFLHRSRR